eukprot:11713469-Alexandrium_andersonii.AAC.1
MHLGHRQSPIAVATVQELLAHRGDLDLPSGRADRPTIRADTRTHPQQPPAQCVVNYACVVSEAAGVRVAVLVVYKTVRDIPPQRNLHRTVVLGQAATVLHR